VIDRSSPTGRATDGKHEGPLHERPFFLCGWLDR
jgi:hypothetical protein